MTMNNNVNQLPVVLDDLQITICTPFLSLLYFFSIGLQDS